MSRVTLDLLHVVVSQLYNPFRISCVNMVTSSLFFHYIPTYPTSSSPTQPQAPSKIQILSFPEIHLSHRVHAIPYINPSYTSFPHHRLQMRLLQTVRDMNLGYDLWDGDGKLHDGAEEWRLFADDASEVKICCVTCSSLQEEVRCSIVWSLQRGLRRLAVQLALAGLS